MPTVATRALVGNLLVEAASLIARAQIPRYMRLACPHAVALRAKSVYV